MNCSLEEYMHWTDIFNFNIADHVKVPDAPGDYVLSFRWVRPPLSKPVRHWLRKLASDRLCLLLAQDCEQTPQIWAGCADIRIE